MRLVPVNRNLSPENKAKSIHLRKRHGKFLAELETMETWEIQDIDSKAIGLNGKTLRELILEIPLKKDETKQAFLSVDRTFNASTVLFYFLKENAAECRSRITTLLPYLVFTNITLEKGIRMCFTPDANERSQGVKWDNNKREVITVDDEIFASFEEWDSDDDANGDESKKFTVDFSEATNFKVPPDIRTEGTKLQAKGNSSVFSQSTFAESIVTKSKSKAKAKKNYRDDSDDDTPVTINKPSSVAPTEAVSSISKDDEISRKLEALTKALLEMSSKMATLEGLHLKPRRAGNSSGTESLGDSVSEAAPL